jgi:hypothetical protein
MAIEAEGPPHPRPLTPSNIEYGIVREELRAYL